MMKINFKMDLRQMGCEGGRLIELGYDHIQTWALMLSMLKLHSYVRLLSYQSP
jgi:hypothetical protein